MALPEGLPPAEPEPEEDLAEQMENLHVDDAEERKKNWTPEQDDLLAERIKNGKSYTAIAIELNRNKGTVKKHWYVLKHAGRYPDVEYGVKLGKWTQEQDDLLAERIKNEKSYAEIAKEFNHRGGVTEGAVKQHWNKLKRAGRYPDIDYAITHEKYTPEQEDLLADHIKNGKSYAAIAKEFNRTALSVQKHWTLINDRYPGVKYDHKYTLWDAKQKAKLMRWRFQEGKDWDTIATLQGENREVSSLKEQYRKLGLEYKVESKTKQGLRYELQLVEVQLAQRQKYKDELLQAIAKIDEAGGDKDDFVESEDELENDDEAGWEVAE